MKLLFGIFSEDCSPEILFIKQEHSINRLDSASIHLIAQSNIVIPMGPDEVYFLNRINCRKSIFTHDDNVIKILDDKILFAEYMTHNFPDFIPATYLIQPSGNLSPKLSCSYPAIFKLAKSCAGFGSYILLSAQDLKPDDRPYIVQEYINGSEEFTAHFYVKNGSIKFWCCFVASEKDPYIKTGSVKNYSV